MKIAWEALAGRSGHAVGRALLEALCLETVGEVPTVHTTAQGKPYFANSTLHFSISHTKNHAFCCLSEHNIGIDAEEAGRDIDPRLAEKILSDAEKARFHAAANKKAALLRLWVLKESYAKLTGRGWGSYLYHSDFSPEDPRIQIIDGCYVAVLEE